ncbi:MULTISPECIES: non-ribosomal peptide synthetase [unclassified Pseudoalteromonas]|uniref:non-ribosomal peptide synthetase n=1 Tax=unclassified Pseudoalteromonas TaxID=194690 RepID=UPI0019D0CAE8|nr:MULTISPECIES: non-ribosomal peptide synthetase [unclassified Pseudoalteromonas]MBR8843074.1 amino acid adenylation domain-containing protein [Pseudoalteromonas sp. JC3]QUI69022.1 amino acid adenylation domain-containing protein [Pseudoalteromonas sp. M8]WJE10767.1 non-ribosomal peptide synthetase [Pseudoalteromonas sp. JC3]
MTIASIIADFESRGVYLWADQGNLKFKAPAGVMTAALKTQLQDNKAALIDYLSDPVMAAIEPNYADRYQPFPLTDLQVAYLVGRNNAVEYGGVGCHSYIELDLPNIDAKRLQTAWHKLVERHDMLRAIINLDGTQQIIAQVTPKAIRVHEFAAFDQQTRQQKLLGLREQLAHRHYQPDKWPQYDLHLSQTGEGSILHFSIDLLIADFASIQIMLAELGELYNHPERALAPLGVSYRDIVIARKALLEHPKTAQRYEQHKAYWLERIKTLPAPPELPRAKSTSNEESVAFSRLHFKLDPTLWQRLGERAARHKLTPSSLVLAAFTEVIGRWSRHPNFCLNLTMLNRANVHPDVRGVVGDFIAVNVLGVSPDPQAGFAKRASQLQQQLWRDLEHSDFTGVEVLRAMNQIQQSNTIVPIVYTSTLGLSGDELDSNQFMHDAQLRYGITQTPQVWLDCQATERSGELIVDWDIRQGIFQAGVIEQAHQAFCELLHELANNEALWQSTSPVSLPKQTQLHITALNDTKTEQAKGYLHSGFARHVLDTPDQIAVIDQNGEMSYQQLAQLALQIRLTFVDSVKPNDHIAIVSDKSTQQIAAVFAVLFADCVYVPIEAKHPLARQQSIIANSGAKIVLTELQYANLDFGSDVTVIAFDQLLPAIPQQDLQGLLEIFTQRRQQQIFVEAPAYVIYTSGTTGQPKGVQLSHGAALNTVLEINRLYDINPKDKTLGLVSYGFDLSVWDIFGTLSAGATLVLPAQELRGDPNHWHQVIAKHQVSLWNSVPAQMQMLMTSLPWAEDQTLSTLRLAMLSGDWIPVQLAKQVIQQLPHIDLNSQGGPTETAIWCVQHTVKDIADDAASVPYGKPLANHQIHILNDRLEPCPTWVTGEMYIAGDGLALGYLNDKQKTAELFIKHPQTGERLYRSGDLGCIMDDGIIAIQGREDGQVKINGHRIELGEIESTIAAHPAVKDVAVVNLSTDGNLAAALVVKEVTDSEIMFSELGTLLNDKLPKYMLPTHFFTLDTLPLSQNSKVDRKQLKVQLTQLQQQLTTQYEAPFDNHVEQTVAQIWRDLLNVTEVSRHDDFFQLGGTSLNAINLLSAFLAAGFDADIDLIFNHAVFSEMSEALAKANEAKQAWLESIDLNSMATEALEGLADALPYDSNSEPKTLFLTGSTGYLGSYVLREILDTTDYRILCLMRCDDIQHGFSRLEQAAAEKGLPTAIPHERIQIISGTMSEPYFGLSNTDYQALSAQVDVIVHNASIINLMDPLSALYPTNVEGAREIIRLASSHQVKPVHYISTIGVHHALPSDVPQPVVEHTQVVPWREVELTYEQSKIMAETLFTEARRHGVPVNILRPGTITWATTETPFINDDAFLKFYRACLNIHAYPASELAVNIVPVDYVATCITAIVKGATGQNSNFHLVSDQSTDVAQIYNWFNELGCDIQPLDFITWKDKLNDNFVRSFVELYFKQGMDSGGHHQYATDNLKSILAQFSLPNFAVSRDYLKPLTQKYNNA